MADLLKYLQAGLDQKTCSAVLRRRDALFRGVLYAAEKKSDNHTKAKAMGWTDSKIEVLCTLNAFYQTVLGPLVSVTRSDVRLGLGKDTPIKYGETVRITQAETESLQICHEQFVTITSSLDIDFWCLQSASAEDLLYRLSHPKVKS